jgi:hypothetical protein
MAKKTGLGRGLAALLGEEGESAVAQGDEPAEVRAQASTGGVMDLPVNQIRRNPRQPTQLRWMSWHRLSLHLVWFSR